MSAVFSGTYSGSFTSTGAAVQIPMPAGFDWMWVNNLTVQYAAGTGAGAQFYFEPATMANGQGTIYTKTNAGTTLNVGQLAANTGFFLYNSSISQPGANYVVTQISNGAPPVVDTATTTNLIDGSTVIRLYNVAGALQLGGMDFTVGIVVPATSFTLLNMPQIIGTGAAATGSYRIIPYDPVYYPTYRYITAISVANAFVGNVAAAGSPALLANQALVVLSVTSNYVIGQKVTFHIPQVTAAAFGMIGLNNLTGTIISIGDTYNNGATLTSTNTIRVNIDVSSFTPFVFPLTGDPAFTPALVTPAGLDTAYAQSVNMDSLADAYRNMASFGVILAAGANSPAGVNGNLISWVAGKSFNGY